MAHRDDTGVGPGANDNAIGTAALIELARAYASPAARRRRRRARAARRAHARLPLDGRRRVRRRSAPRASREHSPFRRRRRRRQPRRDRRARAAADRDRRRHAALAGATLVATAAARDRSSRPATPRRGRARCGQLIDLAFPFTLYEQGPFVGARHPGGDADDGGDRPPSASPTRRPARTSTQTRLGQLGRAAQQLARLARPGPRAGAGHDELRLGRRADRARLGDRAGAGRAARAVLRRGRRPLRALPPAPASRSARRSGRCAAALAFWLFVGLAFHASSRSRRLADGAPRPPEPAAQRRGRLARARAARLLAARRSPAGSSRGSGSCRGARSVARRSSPATRVALLALARRRVARCRHEPVRAALRAAGAARLALAAAAARPRRSPSRLVVFAVGLRGAGRSSLSFAWRFGLGFDAPWYLLELVGVGYVRRRLAISLGWAGVAAAQLAALAAGRYAPYPARERAAAARAVPRARPRRSCSSRARRARRRERAPRLAEQAGSGRAAPAGSSPSPRGTSTSASAAAARAIMCDSCPVSGSSTTRSPSTRARARSELVALGVAPHGAPERARPERRARARATPCSASSAGRTKSSKPTSDETGLPGSPKTSVRPRTPNATGLPGPHGDAPEDLLDAELGLGRAHEVVRRRPRRRRT